MPTFRELFPDLQYLVREVTHLRAHNLRCVEEGNPENVLLFSEAHNVLTCLERALRVMCYQDPGLRLNLGTLTLPNLLEAARARGFLDVEARGWDFEQLRNAVRNARNSILHGDYEQIARAWGCADVPDYFRRYFANDIERLTEILDFVLTRIPSDNACPKG